MPELFSVLDCLWRHTPSWWPWLIEYLMYIYIHMHTYTSIYIYIHQHIYTHIHTHTNSSHIYIYTHMHTHTHMHVHTHINICMHTYTLYTHTNKYIYTSDCYLVWLILICKLISWERTNKASSYMRYEEIPYNSH